MGRSGPISKKQTKSTTRQAAAPSSGRQDNSIPAKRQYLPADERRLGILKAAREVFARTGLQGARTRDLAKAAGINQATLFIHFESKEELFAAAVLQPLVALFEEIRERYEIYELAGSPEDMLRLIQTGMQEHLKSMVDIYPLLVHALSDQQLGKKLYRDHIQPLIKARTGVRQNLIKSSLDPELVGLASFGMFFAVAMDCVMTGKSDDLSDVSRQLAELITNGCSPGQGTDRGPKARARKRGK